MIEKTIVRYLKSVPDLTDIPVYMGEKPIDAGKQYIVIRTIDNGRINHIDAVTFNFESYSTTLQKAAELNQKVKNAMFDAISINNITSSKCGGGGQNINVNTKSYCYECVFNLFYYS